jgi:cell division protein FtsB
VTQPAPAATPEVTVIGGHSEASGQRAASRVRRRAAFREVAYLTGLLLSAGLTYWILILLPSRLHTEELRTRTEKARSEVEASQERIQRIQRDTKALKDDPYLVERTLRTRLGYLAPGERVFSK